MKSIKILLIAFITVVTTSIYAQNNEQPRTIAVQGNGEVSVVPDVANINFNLSATNIDFKKAVNKLNAKVNSLTKALKKVGIPKDEIYSSNYNINKEFKHNYKTGERAFTGYRVSHSIALQTLSETKSVNKVFEAIVSSLNDIELSLSFGLKNSEEFKNIMIKKAIKDAKEKAELMAEISGVKLIKIISINYHNTPVHFRSNSNAMSVSKKMTLDVTPVMVENFNPSKIKRNTTVNIIWEIE